MRRCSKPKKLKHRHGRRLKLQIRKPFAANADCGSSVPKQIGSVAGRDDGMKVSKRASARKRTRKHAFTGSCILARSINKSSPIRLRKDVRKLMSATIWTFETPADSKILTNSGFDLTECPILHRYAGEEYERNEYIASGKAFEKITGDFRSLFPIFRQAIEMGAEVIGKFKFDDVSSLDPATVDFAISEDNYHALGSLIRIEPGTLTKTGKAPKNVLKAHLADFAMDDKAQKWSCSLSYLENGSINFADAAFSVGRMTNSVSLRRGKLGELHITMIERHHDSYDKAMTVYSEKEFELAQASANLLEFRYNVGIPPENIICFDVETTGKKPGNDEILQIAVVNGNMETLYCGYIKPQKRKSWPSAQWVNGISPAMVKDKPSWNEERPLIQAAFSNAKLVIGYNVFFDQQYILEAGILLPRNLVWFDVMEEYAPIAGKWNDHFDDYVWQPLDKCAAHYGYHFAAHDAEQDCKATIYSFYKIAEERHLAFTPHAEKQVPVKTHETVTIEPAAPSAQTAECTTSPQPQPDSSARRQQTSQQHSFLYRAWWFVKSFLCK